MNKTEETILTVTREAFEKTGAFNGYRSLRGKTDLMDLLQDKEATKYIPRGEAEADPTHKQIIPYIAVMVEDQVLVYERAVSGGEERLHGQVSMAIGGHVNTEDDPSDPVFTFINGALREAKEEAGIEVDAETFMKSIYGMVNDDSSSVGQVHLGICVVLKADPGSEQSILNACEHTMLNPRFIPIIDLEDQAFFDQLETWSKYFAMGYIQERSVNGRWEDEGFRERVTMLCICASGLSAAAAGYLLEETPRSHMMARKRLEAGAGEVQAMLQGLAANEDIHLEKVREHAQDFVKELQQSLRYQD